MSVEDVLAVTLAAGRGELPQTVNLVSPNPVRNRDFNRAMGKVMRRPTLLPLPAWFLKLVFGEMSRLLLTGQKVIPQCLQERGYSFKHTTIESALTAALRAGTD